MRWESFPWADQRWIAFPRVGRPRLPGGRPTGV
ncbi:hypothetical protein Ae331Ps2_6188 [Pseudonocardia sp. Ae331_Ps2]|nr:hypothetical protein Ae331Ps2_6188 [Pseudonocardia sp. Ae331_Ps2]